MSFKSIKKEYILIFLLLVLIFLKLCKKKEDFTQKQEKKEGYLLTMIRNMRNKIRTTKSDFNSNEEEILDNLNNKHGPKPEKTDLESIKMQLESVKNVIEYPRSFDNDSLNTLIGNTTIGKINELCFLVKQIANKNSNTIFFNSSLRPEIELSPVKKEGDYYGKYLVSLLNEVSPYSSFSFLNTEIVSKVQHENQVKLHFIIKVNYDVTVSDEVKKIKDDKVLKPKQIELIFEAIILFEKLFYDEENFYEDNNEKSIISFLQKFSFINRVNGGFIPGTSNKPDTNFYVKSKF